MYPRIPAKVWETDGKPNSGSEAFYRIAQAISETLSVESKEKKLLDGFLAGKEKVKEEVRQGRLFA
jgi:hypothetical protein